MRAELVRAVNSRLHRATGPNPSTASTSNAPPACPAHRAARAALGEERLVGSDHTISFNSVRYSTPPGYTGAKVWCRMVGEELAIIAMTNTGTAEIGRHQRSTRVIRASSTSTTRTIRAGITPAHRGRGPAAKPKPHFLAIGDGAYAWLVEAAATGTSRVRAKMARAVEFAAILDPGRVDQALGLAAAAGRFDDTDLGSILDHLAHPRRTRRPGPRRRNPPAEPGTASWEGFADDTPTTSRPPPRHRPARSRPARVWSRPRRGPDLAALLDLIEDCSCIPTTMPKPT